MRAPLRHLIVDEYQDVNPAQERLIELLTGSAGRAVRRRRRRPGDLPVARNRRAQHRRVHQPPPRRGHVLDRRQLAQPPRDRRARQPLLGGDRRPAPEGHGPARDAGADDVVLWTADSEREQAETIADAIDAARKQGYGYGDVAILLRSRTSLPMLLEVLEARGIPVRPDGRTNLFLQRDAQTFGRLCAFLAGHDWRPEQYGGGSPVTLDGLADELVARVRAPRRRAPRGCAASSPPGAPRSRRRRERANLVRDFYLLLELLGVHAWDLGDPSSVTRLGTLARCSQILADYESVRRRARLDAKHPGEQIGGQDRGEWYYRWLAIFVQNYALGAYQDFDGEEDVAIDAVQIGTIHQAKGLEWPIVFVPSVIRGRLPSQRIGQARAAGSSPPALFSQDRYNGTLGDERRLLYVALTRARDQLLVSSFDAYESGKAAASRLASSTSSTTRRPLTASRCPPAGRRSRRPAEPLELTVSDLVAYERLRHELPAADAARLPADARPELGYGAPSTTCCARSPSTSARTRRTPDARRARPALRRRVLPARGDQGHPQGAQARGPPARRPLRRRLRRGPAPHLGRRAPVRAAPATTRSSPAAPTSSSTTERARPHRADARRLQDRQRRGATRSTSSCRSTRTPAAARGSTSPRRSSTTSSAPTGAPST